MSAHVLPLLLLSIVFLGLLPSCVDTSGSQETAHRRWARQRGVRVRRQLSTSTNVVELLVAVDRQAYDKYLARNANNSAAAVAEILRYVAGLVREANERFAHLDTGGFSVRVNLTELIVFTTSAESSATENAIVNGTTINGNEALISFTTQANALAANVSHDYAVLITGYNVTRPNGADADVRTYFKGMCSTLRQGLVENFCVERTALALTRSIALAMGAVIDGINNDCADNFFVQSSDFSLPPRNVSGNPFTFSTCSGTEIRTFLDTSVTACLRTQNSNNAVDVAALTATELGQTYSADTQCVLRFGQGSRLCRALYGVSDSLTYPDDLCRDMRCLIPGTSICQGTLPFDGTSCGNQQWCQDGTCTSDPAAPTTISATCPQGDQPDAECVQFLCAIGGALYRDFICCSTCASSGGDNNVTASFIVPTTSAGTPGTVSIPGATTPAVPAENRTMSMANTGVTSGSQETPTASVPVSATTSANLNVTLSIAGATSPVAADTPTANTVTLSIAGATSPAAADTPTANTATLSIAHASSTAQTAQTLSLIATTQAAATVSVVPPDTTTIPVVGDPE